MNGAGRRGEVPYQSGGAPPHSRTLARFVRCHCVWLAVVVFAAFVGVAQADTVEEAIARADRQPPREALKTLLHVEPQSSGSGAGRAPLLAQISMAWSDTVDLDEKNPVAAEADAKNASEAAERAVKADPGNAKAHLALSIACGKMTDFVDNSTKMALSKRIRDEAQRAIALDPKEDFAYHILGRWNFGIATLNPMLKLAARVAYGALPPASMEEAARNLEKAAALAPRRVIHHQQLALVYKAMGRREKAAEQWKIVLDLPAADSGDEAAKKEAREALGK